MSRTFAFSSVLSALVLGSLLAGCTPGGVGDPCTPEDEYTDQFSGYSVNEVNVESRSFQCETRICLVNHFQGRVSCPYGNALSTENIRNMEPADLKCVMPGETEPLAVAVAPQLVDRRANDAVYCSCRCGGDDPNARYCECPSGFECLEIVVSRDPEEQAQLAGSYCVRTNTNVDPATVPGEVCRLPSNGGTPALDEQTCGDPPAPASG